VITNYTSPSYSGPAIKLGAGVQAYQAYEAAHAAGYRVTGGTCPTVGLVGGYTQGGGHGALTSMYGLGADNVLEWEVVTPKGELVVASPQKNSDLHWALSGGGGGTFGVVVSMTTKLHEDGLTSGGMLSFNTSSGVTAFWNAIEGFQGGLEPLVDSGAVALYQITNTNFLSIYTAPGSSASELELKLEYFTSHLRQLGVDYTFTTSDDDTYFDHFVRYYGPLPAGIWETSHLVSSRLFPRSVIRDNNAGVIAAYKNITSDPNWIAAGLAMKASHATAGNKPGDNAVLPAWRDALIHTLFYSPWDWDAPQSAMQSREDHLTYNIAPMVESLTPGSGTYLNEANFNQMDWQENFYGGNYDELLKIKRKYDPRGLLYARTAVGSEAWAEDGDARLCRTGR
jgi:FAD/FMN-containing dehydrogenase